MLVSPSLLAANAAELALEIQRVESGGAQYLHVDVMDGQFVPTLSFGPNIVAAVRATTHLAIDVHMMVIEPSKLITQFIDAGADVITVHLEACAPGEVERAQRICERDHVAFGLALRPATPVDAVAQWLDLLDFALVMSIEPGRAGDPFQPNALARIAEIRALRAQRNRQLLIGVDGGVNRDNAAQCKSHGADLVVAGSSIFKSTSPALATAALVSL